MLAWICLSVNNGTTMLIRRLSCAEYGEMFSMPVQCLSVKILSYNQDTVSLA